MRHSRDIDLILATEAVVPAADILKDLSFSPVPDGLQRFRMIGTPVLEAEMNNLSFRSGDDEQLVELHWRCHQFAGWPELFENGSNTRLQDNRCRDTESTRRTMQPRLPRGSRLAASLEQAEMAL